MNPFVVLKDLRPKQRQKCFLHKKTIGGKKSGFDTRS